MYTLLHYCYWATSHKITFCALHVTNWKNCAILTCNCCQSKCEVVCKVALTYFRRASYSLLCRRSLSSIKQFMLHKFMQFFFFLHILGGRVMQVKK